MGTVAAETFFSIRTNVINCNPTKKSCSSCHDPFQSMDQTTDEDIKNDYRNLQKTTGTNKAACNLLNAKSLNHIKLYHTTTRLRVKIKNIKDFESSNMFIIGCHLSSSRGFLAMGKEAVKIGANTFQFFTRNPRGSAAKPLDEKDIATDLAFAEKNRLQPILAHAPYTLNACAADEALRNFARETMADDLARLEHIPGSFYNFHPGSHVKQGPETGIRYIAETLNHVLRPGQTTTVLLETMAGKGSEVGRSFEELRAIIDLVEHNALLGVCLDTCHVYDAGYDIRNRPDHVFAEFDRVVGLSRLKAVHLNDSKNEFGSRKDHHDKIGEGKLGLDAIVRLINHPALCNLPFYLETPNDVPGYGLEIALLKSKRKVETQKNKPGHAAIHSS